MLLEEIKNIKSEKKDLRNFGIVFGIMLGLLGGILWWKGKDTYTVLIALSLAFFFFGFTMPTLLKPLQKVWMALAVIIGFFMTKVILSILFYLVFTAIGLCSRIAGKQFLNLKMDKSKKSYWIYRERKTFEKNRYERQF